MLPSKFISHSVILIVMTLLSCRYPEYKEYQKKISRCILGLPGSLGDDKKTK